MEVVANYPDLQNQTALVTGASRGIGLAIARTLVDNGMQVMITARNDDTLQDAVQSFPAGTAIGVAGKSDDPAHRELVLETIAKEFGRLDVLVNNAGINPVYGPMRDLDLGAAEKTFRVNVLATLAWVQAVLRHEALGFEDHQGRIINLSSVTSETPSEGIGLYGISKAAVSHLTQTLAVELGPQVRVNAVSPAVVKTQFAKALYEGKEAEITAQYPLKRLGHPQDIANAVAFLASSASSWITGNIVKLDGGLIIAGGTA